MSGENSVKPKGQDQVSPQLTEVASMEEGVKGAIQGRVVNNISANISIVCIAAGAVITAVGTGAGAIACAMSSSNVCGTGGTVALISASAITVMVMAGLGFKK